MKPARAFVQVVLSVFLVAALVVSSGFAATKKLDRHRLASEEWNDSSLMSGNLLSTGSSVPSGGGPASLSIGSLESPSLILSPGTPDSWLGGTGNWNNADNWDHFVVPGASSDVTIYSGGNDTVTLDTSPTIYSLTLGGASNGTTSELTDGGAAQTLTITDVLTVGQTGYLQLYGGSTSTVGTDLNNAGQIDISNGSHLSTAGSVTSGGTIDLENGSAFTVNGDVTNKSGGTISTSINGGSGGNTLNINHTLNNNSGGTFSLNGSGDVGNVRMLNNSGTVYVGQGSTLNLTNEPGGITDIVAGSTFDIAGTFYDVVNKANALANLNFIEGTLILEGRKHHVTNITFTNNPAEEPSAFDNYGGFTSSTKAQLPSTARCQRRTLLSDRRSHTCMLLVM